jgi:hypothetical protein
LKENIGHVGVVVLAGVDYGLPNSAPFLERAQNRRKFHEIRPGTYDMKDVHRLSAFDSYACS